MEYFWSKYNYIYRSPKFGICLYNSLSGALWQLDNVAEEKVKKLKRQIQVGDYNEKENDIHKALISSCIISENDDTDVLNKLKLEKRLKSFNFYNRTLVLLPTTACNFNCSYCYEANRPNVMMTDDVEDAIFDQYFKDIDPKILYNIAWYGGEPLMNMTRVERISKRLKEKGVNFNASIVTNGYLLKKDIIEKFPDLQIRFVQITIDGDQKTHDQRRCLKSGKGTYYRIVKNLDVLHDFCSKNEMDVNIRVNIDQMNGNRYVEVQNELVKRYPLFFIYAGIVTNYNECNQGCLSLDNRISLIERGIKETNEEVIPLLPDNERNSGWIADSYFSYIIGPEGEMYKCLNDIGKKNMCLGSIFDKQIRNPTVLSRYLTGVDPFENEECLNCFHLPKCNGGCPNEQYLIKYEGVKINPCKYFKKNIDKLLELQMECYKK